MGINSIWDIATMQRDSKVQEVLNVSEFSVSVSLTNSTESIKKKNPTKSNTKSIYTLMFPK